MKAEADKPSSSLSARAAWMVFGRTLGFAVSFALPLLLVRWLSQTDLGLYRQVFLLVNTSIMILPLGLGLSALYFLPRVPGERQPSVVFHILILYALVAGAAASVLAARPDLLARLFGGPQLAELSTLIALVVLTWVVGSFLETAAVANGEMRLAAVFIVSANLTKSVFLLAAALAFGTVRALVAAALVQGCLQTLALLVYLRSRFGAFWRGFEWKLMRTQLAYALPIGFAGLFYSMQLDVHGYFVSHYFGPAAFAVYSIGCFQLPLVYILSDSVGAVMIPRVSRLQQQNDTREIVLLTARMMRKLAFVYLALWVYLLVVGREFVTLLFTERYAGSWPIFAINLTLIPLAVFTNAYDPVMRAYSEHRYVMLKLRAALAALLLAALWYATPRYGLLGAITTVVAVSFVDRVLMSWRVAKILGVERRDAWLLKDVLKIFAAAVVAGIVAAFARALVAGLHPLGVLALCGAVFALVYLACVLALGVLTPEEKDAARRRLTFGRRPPRVPALGATTETPISRESF